ncbi:MAG TPA: septal ring lytic transglycosylase RlpA family protein [Legionellaceae bacterium]|nr:septal ring lytic transglycosylase RlpA family protein [Legionellaceae bacterium]
MKKFLIGIALFSLVGCHTTHAVYHNKASFQSTPKVIKDSAPLGPIPTFFKRIIPKNEPLSRYGNPATYVVDGRRYTVMKTARGYKQRGLASWYGTKFHSRRTSSGEHYNMYELTAAHRTLPLPTYVRVKNLDNGKVAIVKINDRGPFHKARLIDLSYGAAVKLGIYPRGTARVEIETVTGSHVSTAPIAQYYLQAGAYSSRNAAEALKQRIKRFSSAPVFVKTEKRRYVVRLGPFNDRKVVERLKTTLASKGITGSFSLLL